MKEILSPEVMKISILLLTINFFNFIKYKFYSQMSPVSVLFYCCIHFVLFDHFLLTCIKHFDADRVQEGANLN